MTSVNGKWTTATSAEGTVITHDATAWGDSEGFPHAVFTQPASFGEGTIRVDFKLIGADDDYTAGITFGEKAGSYYFVRYNTKDGNVALWRVDGPTRTVIVHGDQHQQLARDTWHTLEVTVTGRTVHATVNGQMEMTHELAEAPPAGPLGLWTKPAATSAFRNLTVK